MYQEYKAAWAALTAPGADFEVTTTNVRGVDIKTYANALTNLRDAWVSTAAYAEREYIVYEDERLTYAQAHEHVNSLGNWLIGQGVQPGDISGWRNRRWHERLVDGPGNALCPRRLNT